MKSGIRSFFRRTAAAALALAAAFCWVFPAVAEDAEEEIDWGEDADVEIPMPAYMQWAVDTEWHTPSENSPVQCEHENCYWNYPMGQLDEDAVWKILTQPITVLDGSERAQCPLRNRPEEDCEDFTGAVTYASQGVHVLKTEGDWTLIEAYSSCTEGSTIKVFAKFIRGYVKTELLKEVPVNQQYGIVVDKLQQRFYLFKEGKLLTTMMCSTGIPNKRKPYQETPAGEFIMISWVGDFWAEDLYCRKAMRINDGILIHEVPCYQVISEETGEISWDYTTCEGGLGSKASHGCIRVQKRKTPEGINEEWLYDNLPRGKRKTGGYVKVIIWDDAGRTLGYPDDDLTLYYNPKGGRNYHSEATCMEVLAKYEPMTPFKYGELEEKPYSKLKRCPACAPQQRKKTIDKQNQ